MTPSLLLSTLPEPETTIALDKGQTHYVLRVLRLRPGDRLFIFDGRGTRQEAQLTGADRRQAVLRCGPKVSTPTESPVRITLMQGLPKADKMDWIVQKVTELGVASILPVITERTQIQKQDKTERWRRIAEAAASQCGRNTVPIIAAPMPLASALALETELGVVLWEEERRPFSDLRSIRRPPGIHLLVGPEGGLTAREVAYAEEQGYARAGLGPRLLRTETAAIVSVALVQHTYGDLG